jgi:hypothetical protein
MSVHLLKYLQILQSIQAFLWFLQILRLDQNTVQVQTNKISGNGIFLVSSPPWYLLWYFLVDLTILHLDHEHILSNPVLETIDYPVQLSIITLLEHLTSSTSHHSF